MAAHVAEQIPLHFLGKGLTSQQQAWLENEEGVRFMEQNMYLHAPHNLRQRIIYCAKALALSLTFRCPVIKVL